MFRRFKNSITIKLVRRLKDVSTQISDLFIVLSHPFHHNDVPDLAIALSIAIAVDLLFAALIALLEWLLGRARGMSVVYGRQANES